MTTLAVQITDVGISAPDYADIFQQFRILYWGLYGSDADLDPDSQDGQFLAALAQAVFDCNQSVIDVYNSFAPDKARGVQLSSLVKINGIRRAVSTRSEVAVVIGGSVGTQIISGVIGDNVGLGTRWDLPTLVEIPIEGVVTVTAVCQKVGAILAGHDTLTEILTPTLGWQSVTNGIADTSPGQAVETDAHLRVRQSNSVALPSLTILDGIFAAIGAVTGVTRLAVYENDSDVTDANGVPSHSISPVVSGGDVQDVAQAIALKKSPGAGTHGTTSVVVLDSRGVPNTISFFQLTTVLLKMQITIHPLFGFVSTTEDLIKKAVSDFVNALQIGEDSYLARLYSPINFGGVGPGATFVVTGIQQARIADALAAADVVINFNEGASLSTDDIVVVLS